MTPEPAAGDTDVCTMQALACASIMTGALAALASPATTQAADYDPSFQSDHGRLQPAVTADNGADLLYIAPGALQRLAAYQAIMVDQPEVQFNATSEYRGGRDGDQQALAEALRRGFDRQLKSGGYPLAAAPGASVLYARPALTDLSLRKKKRSL